MSLDEMISGRVPEVVLQQPADSFSAMDATATFSNSDAGFDQPIAKPLMVPLHVIMGEKLAHSISQRGFSENDHPIETLRFQGSHEPFDKSVQIRRPGGQLNSFHTKLFKDTAKRITELRISIHEDVLAAKEKPVGAVGQIPGDLLHPRRIRIRGAASEVNATCSELYDEERVDSHEATFRPNLDRGEIDGAECVPMGLDELIP